MSDSCQLRIKNNLGNRIYLCIKKQMKSYILLSFCFFSLTIYAQNEKKEVSLEEITIRGKKVINKLDMQTIFPTEKQKMASANGYSILQKLSLPNIRINEISSTISTIDNSGEVQVRIDGIIADKKDLISLNPQNIRKINFIDNPGVRYGENIAYVINIITNKNKNGYVFGFDLTPTLTSLQGQGLTYAKWNTGKNQLSFSYDYSGNKLKGLKKYEKTEYVLNNGEIYEFERNDSKNLNKTQAHGINLEYNWADSTATVFQASLYGGISKTPNNFCIKEINANNIKYVTKNTESNKVKSPILDLYFFHQITPQKSITANTVSTYIETNASNFYEEITPYQYDVNGKTFSSQSEIIYENKIKPFNFYAGINYKYKYTNNEYKKDVSTISKMTQNNVYTFSEIKGSLNDFRYSIGVGLNYIGYKQNNHNYDFWTFRPKVSLDYRITNNLYAKYSYQMSGKVSRIAMISDATIQTNSMELTVGNPDLKPSRDTEHEIKISYNTPRFESFISGYFKNCHKPNMALYYRTEDNHFIYTQINQKEIDVLHTMAYINYWIYPEKLSLALYGGLMRCFNFGNDYTHCYTSGFYTSMITAYFGNWTLQAYTDNGNRFLEGETKGNNCGYTTIQASYRHKDWTFSLYWKNPFTNKYKEYESEIVNTNLHKTISVYNQDFGNSISLNITWRLSRGKKYVSADKTINLQDKETGIIRR
ncbi:MAG: TonB-dependent receptor [Bacteroidaceae bacterium]|nr:TonB-dependent receptor [Bacteroidaceae bacterium]